MTLDLYQIMTDQQDGILSECGKLLLKALSFIYAAAVKAINFAYDKSFIRKAALCKPVISIGNITLGGVGKTPLVMFLVRHIKELNLKPVILTRGYKSRLENGQMVNDEILMLNDEFPDVPVLAGADRFKAAQAYLKDNDADVFIMDDGFQHRKLGRDLDLVALDAANPFGNGELIPRGILREPVSSLRRADIVILTKADAKEADLPLIKEALNLLGLADNVVECVHAPNGLRDISQRESVPLERLKGKAVCLLSAIGDPKSFERLIESLGINITRHFTFRDHHWYNKGDIDAVVSFCRKENIDYIITTQKDSVKMKDFVRQDNFGIHFLSLDISIGLREGKEKIYDRIHSLLQR